VTEHEDIEEFDLEDEELFEEDDDATRVAAASEAVAAWEREHGIELSDSDFNHVATQVDLYGLTPEAAYADSEPGRFEAKYEATVEAVEKEQGRKLLDREVDAIWEAAVRADDDPAVEDVWAEARKATSNLLDTPEVRAEYVGARLETEREREQPSATVVDAEGNERPGFNLEDSSQRAEAIDRLMAGEDVGTFDSSYEIQEGEY
jgi:hypothetical protein